MLILKQSKNLWYNIVMQCKKRGFTLIEVALFLAITGALFAGIMVGVQNSIFQQRFNDSVQNFMEFLRTAYSETMNVQSLGSGRSEKAIYGKLITFNESLDFERRTNVSNENHIYMYDVIGNITDSEHGVSATGSTLDVLDALDAHVIMENDDGSELRLNGIVESYVPKWGAAIQDSDGNIFSGSLLIVRHPNSGVVYTFFNDNTIEVNTILGNSNPGNVEGINWKSGFALRQIDFCVNPMGMQDYSNRQDVRIVANARSGSGIELVPESDENNVCVGGQ